jgi:NAD(P)-dependent dehydrogenase (short-subunit alcohol dehydrogenase family)
MHRVYDVNALGPLRVAGAFLPLLRGGRTRIVVNVSSEAGSIAGCGRDSWYGYCMSKAALNMASALMHNTLRPLGGCVVVVHPGWVRTWMRGHLDEDADLSPAESAAGIIEQIDRARRGDALFRQERPAFIDWKGDTLPW